MELFPAHLADKKETNTKSLTFFEALYRALFWALFPELPNNFRIYPTTSEIAQQLHNLPNNFIIYPTPS